MSSMWLSRISLSLVTLWTHTHTHTYTLVQTPYVWPEEMLWIVYCCIWFLRGIEENRNGQERPQKEEEAQGKEKEEAAKGSGITDSICHERNK